MSAPTFIKPKSPPRPLEVRTWQDLARGYLDIVEKLHCDFQRDLNCTAYALDFAELHLYMHRHRSVETREYGKFDLIGYILENTRHPDALTILPPTVFEFLRYMTQVSSRLSKLSSYGNILNNRLIADFFRIADDKNISDDYYRKVLTAYKQMDGISQILLMGTEKGFKEIIGGPLSKFVELIKDRKILPLENTVQSCDIKDFDINNTVDPEIYRSLLGYFQRIRDKPVNNKVDAMAGSMIFRLNGMYYDEKKLYSNLLTHSKHCLDVMEKEEFVPSSDPLSMSVVRDPVYFLSRILCWELSDNSEERLKLLKSIEETLKLISSAGSAEELLKKIQELEKAKAVLSSAEFFERIFVYDNDWGSIIRTAYAQVYENSYVSNFQEIALESDSKLVDLLTSQPYRDIEILKEAFGHIDEYKEQLKKASVSLQQEIGKLYTELAKFV